MSKRKYQNMRINCRKNVEENFSIEKMVENYEKVYQKVKKLIILPHTINYHENLLKSFGSNINIVCR